ncbi:ferrous iron transport protein B [Candidatus Bandiella numerosa]|uniref:ferrous iron transport protein B n=1 Tax=Candidatus Bandiella numerosa TaxID=2570586 RepID=UPI00249E96FB|nr:ferrous iron transport protein B [Candidatus Bandiella numerosa]WHA05087.1 ferrous iron transport protein B [Candidatus Bandiella numerosa]
MEKISLGIIGNPNSGKSTIFNQLTGLGQKTGNWSGVTVEKRVGEFKFKNHKIQLIDLPGLYSLGIGGKTSLDQDITINYIKEGDFDYLINVVDSANFKRNLYLTFQLIERGIPVILVLNMDDIAKSKNIKINENKLSKLLKCPVIKVSAKKTDDINILKDFLLKNKDIKNVVGIFDFYPKKIKEHYLNLENFLNIDKFNLISNSDKISILEGNYAQYNDRIKEFAKNICNNIEIEFGQTSDFVLVNCRYAFIEKLFKKVCENKDPNCESLSDKIDNIALNTILGAPIFLIVLYLMFVFSINVGGAFQEFFGLIAEATFIDIPLLIASKIYTSEWLNILIYGLGGAVQTIASFIPIIAAMYMFLSFLEDSGYIARSAVIANKIMRLLGLSGHSFLPLIVGLGCNVPAITGTRVLYNHNQRISTIMMSPFVSCTARLAVYTLFCYIFFPNNTQNVIFTLYIIGILMAIFTGLLIKNKAQKIADSNMLIELPDYKLPKLKVIINSSILRTKSFIFGAGKTIVVVFFIIHLVNSIKIPIKNEAGTYNNENIINIIGKRVTLIFKPMGLEEKNWPATVGIITGIFAKEIVVGTLVSLYADESDNSNSVSEIEILTKYKKAFLSVPKKMVSVFTDNFDKLYYLDNNVTKKNYLDDNEISNKVIKNISNNFDNKIAVLSYLIFILIYFPCVSVFGAISNEIGKKWAIASALWSTISAYSVSIMFYQTSNFIMNNSINYYYLLLGIMILIISSISLRYFYTTQTKIN